MEFVVQDTLQRLAEEDLLKDVEAKIEQYVMTLCPDDYAKFAKLGDDLALVTVDEPVEFNDRLYAIFNKHVYRIMEDPLIHKGCIGIDSVQRQHLELPLNQAVEIEPVNPVSLECLVQCRICRNICRVALDCDCYDEVDKELAMCLIGKKIIDSTVVLGDNCSRTLVLSLDDGKQAEISMRPFQEARIWVGKVDQ